MFVYKYNSKTSKDGLDRYDYWVLARAKWNGGVKRNEIVAYFGRCEDKTEAWKAAKSTGLVCGSWGTTRTDPCGAEASIDEYVDIDNAIAMFCEKCFAKLERIRLGESEPRTTLYYTPYEPKEKKTKNAKPKKIRWLDA
jgi:hypothetical protein